MVAMQQEAAGQTSKSRFNPNESLFIQDKSLMNKGSIGGMTISHFGTKTSPRSNKSPLKTQQYHPTYPNEKAQGLI